jgi:hypothetical protein
MVGVGCRHVWLLQVLAVLNAAIALRLTATVVMFVLDVIQLRAWFRQSQGGLRDRRRRALIKHWVSAMAIGWIAVRARASPMGLRSSPPSAASVVIGAGLGVHTAGARGTASVGFLVSSPALVATRNRQYSKTEGGTDRRPYVVPTPFARDDRLHPDSGGGYVVSVVAHVVILVTFFAPVPTSPARELPESFQWAKFLLPRDRTTSSTAVREHVTYFETAAPGGQGT